MSRRHSMKAVLAVTGLLLTAAGIAARAAVPDEMPDKNTVPEPAATPAVTLSATSSAEQTAAPVIPGLEVLLRDSVHLIRGKRVGFLTNQTAVTSTGESGIDLLHASPDVNLVALYGPEHGLRGGVEGGVRVDNERDAATGLPVFSLYGQTQRPTAEMLRGVDVLLFDMQDIGARPYTFVWTMAMSMESAAARGIPFIVLDRPNPITSRVGGGLMDFEMRNVGQAITGYFPVPLRHGMTVGEIARYINAEYKLGVDLTVIPAEGWKSDRWFDETGLPWINPSPNIRSLEAALNYSGLVLLEATNLTVGRGTDAPFSYVGAPWLDTARLLERLATYSFPGVTLSAVTLTPEGEGWIPFKGERTPMLRLTVTDRDVWDPVWFSLALLTEVRKQHPKEFQISNEGFTQMLGSRWARAAFDRGDDPRTIYDRWEAQNRSWEGLVAKYRLYPAR
ncbi:MAG: DUF1343 domain-containing protein [Gemmatimonadota bacterium]|nr:DUF1343 domain-containing protein [Gemmatimonadota bacterium]